MRFTSILCGPCRRFVDIDLALCRPNVFRVGALATVLFRYPMLAGAGVRHGRRRSSRESPIAAAAASYLPPEGGDDGMWDDVLAPALEVLAKRDNT